MRRIVTLSFDHTFSISQAEGRCKHCAHELRQSVMRISDGVFD